MLTSNIKKTIVCRKACLVVKKNNSKHYSYFKLLSFLFILIISPLAHAQQQTPYRLTQIADLNNKNITNINWVNLLANPRSNSLYYIINNTGQLFIVDDGKIKTPAIIDFSHLKNNTANKFNQLNTMVLHPNFAFRDQVGFATFYTAHVEEAQQDKQKTRLLAQQPNVAYLFDTVITEWQFNLVNLQKVDISSQREIMRIALPNSNNAINQLAFNPYIKPWDDDFGFLYMSLTQNSALKEYPLYSGAILRIKPTKFGQKEYTSPSSNPFVNDITMTNELFIVGIGKIEQFIWPQKNNNDLLISHKKNNQNLLSLSGSTHNWQQEKHQEASIDNEYLPSLFLYRGRELTELRKKIIFINKSTHSDNMHWQLSAAEFIETDYIQNNKDGPSFTAVWQFDNELIASKNTIKLQVGNKNELLLIDKTNQFIYGLSQQSAIFNDKTETDKTLAEQPVSSNVPLFIFMSICLLAGIFYLIRDYQNKKKSLSQLIKRSYSRVELSTSTTSLLLFKHRQKTPDITLKMADIMSVDLLLNDESIHIIKAKTSSAPCQALSNEIERQIRVRFADVHQEKMVDDKVRKISWLIVNNQKKSYLVTLYLRRGHHRFTKSKWSQVIEDLLNLSWLLSEKITFEQTEQRKIKPKVEQQSRPLSPAKKMNNPENNVKDTATKEQRLPTKNEGSVEQVNYETTSTQSHLIDTELINALEKLVNLKKQGFLTDREFDLAKQKVLKDLMTDKK